MIHKKGGEHKENMYKYFVSYSYSFKHSNSFGFGCNVYELNQRLKSMDTIARLGEHIAESLKQQLGRECDVVVLNFQRIED